MAAFAEALLPGSRLPAAERDVPVVAPLERLLAAAPARARLGVRIALRGLGPRFARRRLGRRSRALLRMQSSRLGVRRDLFLLLKALTTLAWARDGGVTAVVAAEGSCSPAPASLGARLDPADMTAPGGVERCDAVVVGSGAGGAAAARTLAEAGLSVIVVEEGDYHDANSYSRDPLAALSMLYRDGGLTACEGRPVIPLPLGRCVGGTTVVNSGSCFRAPGDVLARWRDELGITWATELDREFEALERDLRVAPVDPATAGRNAELCRAGAEAIGASNGPIARNAGDVSCCGTCPTGCAVDAKQAVHVSELPRAVAAGARIRAGVRVERILIEGGRAVGVRAAGYEVRARAVVLAGGAIGTPELLLAGALGGREVGRHLHIHPACWVGARFDEEVRGWEGVMQSWYVDEWHHRGLFLEATFTPLPFGAHWLWGAGVELEERIQAYGHLAVIGVHRSDLGSGRVTRRGIRYRLRPEDVAALRFGIARAADLHFAAGAREVYPQVARIAALGPGEQAAFEHARVRPADLRLEAFHPMGTARMAADPTRSVVAPDGEVHDVPGLLVADASLFPTSLNVNPMITIMACARRIAAGLAERLT